MRISGLESPRVVGGSLPHPGGDVGESPRRLLGSTRPSRAAEGLGPETPQQPAPGCGATAESDGGDLDFPTARDPCPGRALVADGGMGVLVSSAVPRVRTPEEANLRAPEAVVKLHVGFIQAGADLIETNTFGANRRKLAAN